MSMQHALTAPPGAPKRLVVTSKSRAAAIVERVADKHRISVKTLLCARWDRFVLIARAEAATALRDDLNWSQRAIGGYIGCTQPNVRKLFSFHEKYTRRMVPLGPTPDPDGRIRDLEAEVARLSGTFLCERLSAKFDMPMRAAIVLAILAEAYPRYVRGTAMRQLYDEACERIGYGARNGATGMLLRKNLSSMQQCLAAHDAPTVSEMGLLADSRRMTEAGAAWLYAQCGAPRLSAVEQGRELAEAAASGASVHAAGV